LESIGSKVSPNQRVISFVAGKKTSLIESFLLNSVPVLRVCQILRCRWEWELLRFRQVSLQAR
jgi:hypothetical protein